VAVFLLRKKNDAYGSPLEAFVMFLLEIPEVYLIIDMRE
jgi:hypothetical protein